MAGAVLERQLTATQTGGIRFSIATEHDDAEIRRLLRENPMPGRISLSFEREPNFFANTNFPFEIKKTIVARDGGQLVCVGSCAVRQRYINGKPRSVGYLGGLRLDARHAGRFDILRRGYKFFRQLEQESPADFYFTSIAADNDRARSFLERGLPGMPQYEFLCEFVTLTIPTSSRRRFRPGDHNIARPDSAGELVGFLNERDSAFQLTPHWSAEELAAYHELGLHASNFLVLRFGRQIEACGALWDQRKSKQIVVRGYSPLLATARPFLNAFSSLANQPRLPAISETLSIAFASHLASRTDASLIHLLQHLKNSARQRGIELLTFGFASNDLRLASIRQHFRCREYHSRLYMVHWPGIGGTALELDNHLLAPEVALL